MKDIISEITTTQEYFIVMQQLAALQRERRGLSDQGRAVEALLMDQISKYEDNE